MGSSLHAAIGTDYSQGLVDTVTPDDKVVRELVANGDVVTAVEPKLLSGHGSLKYLA
jgi:hypothetical protein